MSLWGKIIGFFTGKKMPEDDRKRLYVPKDDSDLAETRVLTPEEVDELEKMMKDEDDDAGWDKVE